MSNPSKIYCWDFFYKKILRTSYNIKNNKAVIFEKQISCTNKEVDFKMFLNSANVINVRFYSRVIIL